MIDNKLQEELRAKFNPDGSDLRNLQLRMLEILKYIDRICVEHGIQYWLSYGTCLGAVRHGGFIPWDDDVDIEMFEKDYKRFRDIMISEHNSDYVFQNHNTDKNFLLTFGKVRDCKSFIEEDYGYDKKYKYRGCYVDIFPISRSNSKLLFTIGMRLNMHLLIADHNENKYKKMIWQYLNKIGLPILKILTRIGNRDIYRESIGAIFPEIRYYNDIKDSIRVKFEDSEFPIPRNYDSYLTTIYGDYMRIPNIEDVQIHTSKFKLY